jgi:transposase
MAQCRAFGVFLRERDFADADGWTECRRELPADKATRSDLDMVWEGYAFAAGQAACLRNRVIEQGRQEPTVRRLTALPGVAWIRASTFYAYVDTPFRFRKKQALWRYLGIGLERRVSGEGFERVRVAQNAHHTLKDMILGAAVSAIASRKNPFADQYRRWTDGGMLTRNARRNVARSLATVMWGMWKSGEAYRPDWVAE